MTRFGYLLSAVAFTFVTGACAQTDAGVTSKVKAKFAADDVVKAHQIDVTTNDHVVTLTGSVDSPTVRERAVRLAKETDGVRDVVDDLHVAATSGSLDSIGDDIEHGAKETADAVKKGAQKTGDAAKETGEKIKDVFTDKDRDSDKDGK